MTALQHRLALSRYRLIPFRVRLLVGLLALALVVAGALVLRPSHTEDADAALSKPAAFDSLSAKPGPGVGEITFTWAQSGKNTTGYRLQTALTIFDSTTAAKPKGIKGAYFDIPVKARSFTLTKAQVEDAGAGVGTGNNLMYRFQAIKTDGAKATVRNYPGMGGVMPKVDDSAAANLRVASFNVRTTRATGDARPWPSRVFDVAKQIADVRPQVAMIQELGPGRADGKATSLNGTMRQTTSLVKALASIGTGDYQLVRETAYAQPGTASGSQGMRLLYDADRLKLLSDCSETTGKSSYSADCSVKLPLLKGDAEGLRRRAAYARFQDLKTGKKFWAVSVHLDIRHSASTTTEKKYTGLRSDQVATAVKTVTDLDTTDDPILFGGDLNSWQNLKVGNGPHDELVDRGFYDTAHAKTQVNLQYSTLNNFVTTQRESGQGYGARLDVIGVKGVKGVDHFENVTKVTDNSRPSDHNLVYADITL